jgi:O-antigen/teichoic acid export membrane protein
VIAKLIQLKGHINFKGDLFATAFSFAAQAIIRLASSLILTRILNPEAYGVITVVMSIVFVVEMLADIGVGVFIIRDKNGEEQTYLNTAWTLRLGRGLINSVILLVAGPFIAATFYHLPALAVPLRLFSLWFVIAGLESMSFPLAIRRKRARIVMYSELTATFLSTVFSVTYTHFSRDYWGLLYGILLNRLLTTLFSYQFFKEFRPRLGFNRAAARDIMGLTKFTMPSSLLMLGLSQFDKIVFLRFFDLRLLGVYGLAGNIGGPVEALISKISQTVLYPRCAHNFREDPDTFALKYYTDNIKLFAIMLTLPAILWGFARLLVDFLYPERYAEAGAVLEAFMIRASLLSLYSPAEDVLIAAGESHILLVANIFRAIWIVAAGLGGYYFLGFMGFVYGVALGNLPPLVYYIWLQRKKGMLIPRFEFYKIAVVVCVAVAASLMSHVVHAYFPALHLRR